MRNNATPTFPTSLPPSGASVQDDGVTQTAPEIRTPPGSPNPMSVDIRHVSLTLVGIVAVIWLLKNTQDVLIPFVVSGLLFYALDPIVDRLERWRIPRVIGATVFLLGVVGAIGGTLYQLTDELVAVVEQLPTGVRKLRDELGQARGKPGAIEKLQEAADSIDRGTAAAAAPTPTPQGVVRVQVEEPIMRTADYVWAGWLSLPAFVSVIVMIFFLTLFLLVADDLFKRKLVRNVGDGLSQSGSRCKSSTPSAPKWSASCWCRSSPVSWLRS